jgi:hypothetical protein
VSENQRTDVIIHPLRIFPGPALDRVTGDDPLTPPVTRRREAWLT